MTAKSRTLANGPAAVLPAVLAASRAKIVAKIMASPAACQTLARLPSCLPTIRDYLPDSGG